MRKYIAIGLILSGLILGGCGSGQLKNNLGDYQYMGIDPQLEIEIVKQEIDVRLIADGELSLGLPPTYTSELKYMINVTQHNKDFPVKKYNIHIIGKLVDPKGDEKDELNLNMDVTNGVASVTDAKDLYSVNKTSKDLKFRIDKYTWMPVTEYKPYVPSK